MLQSINILAISDTATYAMFAINLLGTLGIGTGVTILFRAQDRGAGKVAELSRKLEEAETRRRQEVTERDAQIHEVSEKLIDLRMRKITHDVANHAQTTTGTLDVVTRRIAATEDRISKLGELSHDAEIKLLKAAGEFQDFVRKCAPSREEFTRVERAVEKLAENVNDLARETINTEDMRKLLREVRG